MKNSPQRLILWFLATAAFVLSCFWCYFDWGFEPIIVAVVSLSVLIGLSFSGSSQGEVQTPVSVKAQKVGQINQNVDKVTQKIDGF